MRGSAAPVLILILSTCLEAQQPGTRADAIRQQRAVTARAPVTPDEDAVERAIIWAYDHNVIQILTWGYHGIAPRLGGMINNSGLAFGPEYIRPDLSGGKVNFRSTARLSTRLYEMYDSELGIPKMAGGKAFLDFYARHRNYPQVDYYGPGPNSSRHGRSDYRLEDTQFDVTAGLRPLKWLRLGGTGGYYMPNVGPGTRDSVVSTDKIYSPLQAPGIDRQPNFLRGGGLVQVDYRDNPYGPWSGGQYYSRFDYFQDREFNRFSFRRLTTEVQQYFPLFNKKRVIVARAKSVMSFTNDGQVVPFYLQPSIGSSQDVRGYHAFRFYDNNTWVANLEWRWEVLTSVDAALFFDAGKVAPRVGLLNFQDVRKSFGGGFRLRAPETGAIVARIDFAGSSEGFRVWLTFQDVFATPGVRTGAELSPPFGRLP